MPNKPSGPLRDMIHPLAPLLAAAWGDCSSDAAPGSCADAGPPFFTGYLFEAAFGPCSGRFFSLHSHANHCCPVCVEPFAPLLSPKQPPYKLAGRSKAFSTTKLLAFWCSWHTCWKPRFMIKLPKSLLWQVYWDLFAPCSLSCSSSVCPLRNHYWGSEDPPSGVEVHLSGNLKLALCLYVQNHLVKHCHQVVHSCKMSTPAKNIGVSDFTFPDV